MDYIQSTENIKILHQRNHSSEIRVGPYLTDGYDPETKTVFEFYGCYYVNMTRMILEKKER